MKNFIRYFRRNKAGNITILLSLVIAFTTILLIGGYVVHEYSVDTFHVKKDRICQLQSDDPWVEGKKFDYITYAVPQYLKNNFPDVENYCQWNKNGYEKMEINKNTFYKGLNIYETQPSFFQVFSYPFKYGNPGESLNDISKIVLTEKTATKLFGDINPVGEPVKVTSRDGEKTFFVSGVLQSPPNASHLNFDMLTSIEGKEMRGCKAYLLLAKEANIQRFENKLQEAQNDIPFFGKNDFTVKLYLQPLTKIYQTAEVKRQIAIFLIIAALILFVAFFNYINLFLTQMQERTGELGIRRVIGGSFACISASMVREYSLLITIALLLSIPVVRLVLPLFNTINETKLEFADYINWPVFAIILLSSLVVGLVSIPIVYSRVKQYLGGKNVARTRAGQVSLIGAFQFAVSIALIISTFIILKQINFIHHKDIGLDRDVVEIQLPPTNRDKTQLLRQKLLECPAIAQVSLCSASPVREGAMLLFHYEKNGEKHEYSPLFFQGDQSYINILGIRLLEGSNFYETPAQNNKRCLITKKMVDFLNLEHPVGSILPGSDLEVIGVVENFHWRGLETEISPAIIAFNEWGVNTLVKTNPLQDRQAVEHIKKCWKETIPDYPPEFWTIGELFNQKHEKQEMLVRFISFFCLVAIFLTVIGGIARTASVIKHRTKEVGIRRVNGATITEILAMLNRDFVKWVLIAFVIATPIAYYAMNKWLENFAYKTALSWWIFALAGLLALGIALLTVSWQSWRAATRNPVEALRYE